jgi:hypothetical protein
MRNRLAWVIITHASITDTNIIHTAKAEKERDKAHTIRIVDQLTQCSAIGGISTLQHSNSRTKSHLYHQVKVGSSTQNYKHRNKGCAMQDVPRGTHYTIGFLLQIQGMGWRQPRANRQLQQTNRRDKSTIRGRRRIGLCRWQCTQCPMDTSNTWSWQRQDRKNQVHTMMTQSTPCWRKSYQPHKQRTWIDPSHHQHCRCPSHKRQHWTY